MDVTRYSGWDLANALQPQLQELTTEMLAKKKGLPAELRVHPDDKLRLAQVVFPDIESLDDLPRKQKQQDFPSSFRGIPIVVDEKLEPGVLEVRNGDGKTIGRLTGLSGQEEPGE